MSHVLSSSSASSSSSSGGGISSLTARRMAATTKNPGTITTSSIGRESQKYVNRSRGGNRSRALLTTKNSPQRACPCK